MRRAMLVAAAALSIGALLALPRHARAVEVMILSGKSYSSYVLSLPLPYITNSELAKMFDGMPTYPAASPATFANATPGATPPNNTYVLLSIDLGQTYNFTRARVYGRTATVTTACFSFALYDESSVRVHSSTGFSCNADAWVDVQFNGFSGTQSYVTTNIVRFFAVPCTTSNATCGRDGGWAGFGSPGI